LGHILVLAVVFLTILIFSVDFRLTLITMIIRMYLRLLISDLDLHSAEVHIVSILGIVQAITSALFLRLYHGLRCRVNCV